MNKQTAILKLMATAKALEKGQLYPEGAEKDFGFILDEYHKAESQKSDSLPNVSDQRELLIKYQNWYWKEVQGKPYQTSASEIVDSFDE